MNKKYILITICTICALIFILISYIASYTVLKKIDCIRSDSEQGGENRMYVARYKWLAKTMQVFYYPVEYFDIVHLSGNHIEDSGCIVNGEIIW